jgi:3-oxoacyl-[acyl-carrier protein] reductase
MRPVALVTGAARGIGRACAERLARSGFDVALVDRDGEDLLAELAREIEALGGSACDWTANVADVALHAEMIARVVKRWDRLDCLVNNAGLDQFLDGDRVSSDAISWRFLPPAYNSANRGKTG